MANNVFGEPLITCSNEPITGLKAGEKWCLCALRWKEALQHNYAPKVVLEATHEKTLDVIALNDLIKHASR
jgi:uncharacterized protein (DUF2237 family)